MENKIRRKGIDRRHKQVEVKVERRKSIEQRTLASRRTDNDRREFLSNRRSYIERRKRYKRYPFKNRRLGIGRRVLLSNRRGYIDRRDMAFFESLMRE